MLLSGVDCLGAHHQRPVVHPCQRREPAQLFLAPTWPSPEVVAGVELLSRLGDAGTTTFLVPGITS